MHTETSDLIGGFLLALRELEAISLEVDEALHRYYIEITETADYYFLYNDKSVDIQKAISSCDAMSRYIVLEECKRAIPSKASAWLREQLLELKDDITIQLEVETSA